MSDLRERIAEIVEQNAMDCMDAADQIIALLKQEPWGWHIPDANPHAITINDADNVEFYRGRDFTIVPLYAAPVVPEGERVEGWAIEVDGGKEAGDYWEVMPEREADSRRAILIFPEDKQ